MTPEEFLDRVREENDTALSRLGSSKSLYAETRGEMEAGPVLRAAATAEHHAAETFAAWAETEEDDEASAAWEATAAEERDHYETVRSKVDGDHEVGEVPAIQAYLRGLETTVERVGGFLGRVLASDKSKEQMTGFFVGQADPQTANLFRELRGDLEGQQERATDLLGAVCEDDEDWTAAVEAASGAIQAAYEEYTETLEGMGVNPKPVC